jgi:FlaA1/EpsC-like NDP-sugar epimerase
MMFALTIILIVLSLITLLFGLVELDYRTPVAYLLLFVSACMFAGFMWTMYTVKQERHDACEAKGGVLIGGGRGGSERCGKIGAVID